MVLISSRVKTNIGLQSFVDGHKLFLYIIIVTIAPSGTLLKILTLKILNFSKIHFR